MTDKGRIPFVYPVENLVKDLRAQVSSRSHADLKPAANKSETFVRYFGHTTCVRT